MLIYDNSQPGGTQDRILASFGQANVPARRHPLRRLRRELLRGRAMYAIAAIAVFALMLELVAIVVIRP